MKKQIWVLIFITLGLILAASSAYSEMAKEGSHSGKNYSTGTSKAIPMGEERLHLTIDGSGIYVSDEDDGFLNNSSMHLLGTLHSVKGVFEDSGFIVFNLPDGDKVYASWKGTGNLGKDAKGTITYVGGTGKYAGLTGGGEYTRRHLPNASKNVWAAITTQNGYL